MAQTAAHLVECVIPWVPTRQWVVVSLQRAGKYQRLAWRPSQEQKGIDERALMASLQPSPPS